MGASVTWSGRFQRHEHGGVRDHHQVITTFAWHVQAARDDVDFHRAVRQLSRNRGAIDAVSGEAVAGLLEGRRQLGRDVVGDLPVLRGAVEDLAAALQDARALAAR